MQRREFFTAAGSLGLTATGCTTQSEDGLSERVKETEGGVQSNDGAVIHNWESEIMRGFPSAPENQVTRENHEESVGKLRWAMQHWRELYPTQRVSRGASPVITLPRQDRDVMALQIADMGGGTSTVADEVRSLSMDAFVILQHGKILCEHYFHGMRPETPHILYSMNKSIVSSVIATLLGDELRETAKIEEYVPQLKDTAYAGATIRQILDMESGVLYGYTEDKSQFSVHEQAISPVAKELGVPVGDYNFLRTLIPEKTRPHGYGMRYKESDPGVLVWAAERVTGKRFAQLVQERLWGPLGCEFDMDAVCDPLGHFTYHLACCLRDVARWGVMCLNKGRFNGQQIVPEEFFNDIQNNATVDRLTNSEFTGDLFPPETGYRSFFYHHRKHGRAIAAAGIYGQFCYMNPRSDIVIAFFSSTEPWGAQLAAKVPFDRILEKYRAQEIKRRHLCHEIARLLRQ